MNNKNKILHLGILLGFLLLCFPLQSQNIVETQVVYLSGKDRANAVEWEFYCTEGMNSGKWEKIPVPSNWELEGFGNYNYGHDHRDTDKKQGKERGLYRHAFHVPSNWKGRSVNIIFEGSMTDTQVKINGRSVGEMHQGAFYRFKYDISRLLRYGQDNLLEVDVAKVSSNESVNQAERQADYWIFGGIFRPVYLEVLPTVHMHRVAVDARANGELTANVFINGPQRNMTVRAELFTSDGQKLGQTFDSPVDQKTAHSVLQASFGNVRTWNPESPSLYSLRVSLYRGNELAHVVEERIGFRTVELLPNNGIYVNGKKIVLKGINRHSFRPKTGRSLSESDQIEDVMLIKEMNMNAVRMSHYPPDKRFLDMCDSLGLFVLNELAGWQQGYDTIVGSRLIYQMILRDENHPSVIIWNHGNEGGWDLANERWFHVHDFQKRPILHPIIARNHLDTRHYPNYNDVVTRFRFGNEIFLPTEFLHGMYDGGHGAGLEDYWNAFRENPRYAGGFLWVLRDEAVWRTDLNIYDGDGNHAPDGILGPNNEKEGSFYTVKEIWSPVQIKPFLINKYFNGSLNLENQYIYSNLKECKFSWQIIESGPPDKPNSRVIASGVAESPDIKPGESGSLILQLPQNFMDGDILSLTAEDHHGREIYTWTWMIKSPREIAVRITARFPKANTSITIRESGDVLHADAGNLAVSFSIKDGTLLSVTNGRGPVSFNGGPVPVGHDNVLEKVSWQKDKDGNLVIEGSYKDFPSYFKWKLLTNGLLSLEVAPPLLRNINVDYLGVTFNYPEAQCEGMQWLGKGPFRVYKNRLKGTTFNVWDKDYNNTVTGESFDNLIYPEFKGYHSNIYWAKLRSRESDFTIYCETPNIYLRLFTPERPKDPTNIFWRRTVSNYEDSPRAGSDVDYPNGDISFLYEIPAIGTKFLRADELGPASQLAKYRYAHPSQEQRDPMRLWFDFVNY
jgi:hypothetical protein